jgi:DNA end-binding protein Ku
VDKRELTMAKQLIETLSADFEPEKYKDEYREAVLELIRKKAKGETVTVKAPAAKAGKVTDLAGALEETLKLVREKRAKGEVKAKSGDGKGEHKKAEAKPAQPKRGTK